MTDSTAQTISEHWHIGTAAMHGLGTFADAADADRSAAALDIAIVPVAA